mmetsp:Transcript_32251/g.60739  ORF Transcript_32251/g.60739 Transcript_32251/m.60739 type:complete len:231 (-) Transcript_32251:307-999(-)
MCLQENDKQKVPSGEVYCLRGMGIGRLQVLLDLHEKLCLPGIQRFYRIKITELLDKSVHVVVLEGLRQVAEQLSFPGAGEPGVQRPVFVQRQVRSDAVTAYEMQNAGIQEVLLGTKLEQRLPQRLLTFGFEYPDGFLDLTILSGELGVLEIALGEVRFRMVGELEHFSRPLVERLALLVLQSLGLVELRNGHEYLPGLLKAATSTVNANRLLQLLHCCRSGNLLEHVAGF